MKYLSATVSGGTRPHNYLVEADDFLSKDEIQEKVVKTAVYEEMCVAEDIEDALCYEYKYVADELTDDDFSYQVMDFDHVRLVEGVVRMSDRFDGIIINVYEVNMRRNIGEEPMHVVFETDCGQPQDVDYVATVDHDHPMNEVRESAWTDCMYQLKRYCHVDGMGIIRGIFSVSRLSQPDFEQMYNERLEFAVA